MLDSWNMICSRCNKEFIKTRNSQKYCSKKCSEETSKEYYRSEVYKKKHRESQKKYKEKNKDYYDEKDKIRSKDREYFKKYRATESYKVWKRNYNKKFKENPENRILEVTRSYISSTVKKFSGKIKKTKKTINYVGLTKLEFKKYLEDKFLPGMTWDNYGKWHIDHIKPISKFNLTKEGELEKCFHYSNLQPLWAIDNLKKNNKF